MDNSIDFRRVGIRIQKYRLEKNMTQENLAELIDSSQKYLSTVEAGKHRLSLDMVVSIAKALEIPVDSLIADYDNSSDESNLYLILDEIRGMSPKQLEMLRENIKTIKKFEIR